MRPGNTAGRPAQAGSSGAVPDGGPHRRSSDTVRRDARPVAGIQSWEPSGRPGASWAVPRPELVRPWTRGNARPLGGSVERILPVRSSIITAALLAVLGSAVALPASAAPIGPGAVAAPAGLVSTVQMDRMERHMMRRRMEHRMMRHRMERHMMHREMRHRMMRREMMHRM